MPRHRARLDVGSGPLLAQLHPALSVLVVPGADARALVAAQLLAEGLGARPAVRPESLVLHAADLPAPPTEPDRPGAVATGSPAGEPAAAPEPADDPLLAERRHRHAERVRLAARRAALAERTSRPVGDPRAARAAWLGLVVSEERSDELVATLHDLADEWDELLARLAEVVEPPSADELDDARARAATAAEALAGARATTARAARAREEVRRLDRAHAELVELERVEAERRATGDPQRRRALLDAREARLLVQLAAAGPADDVDALEAELAAVRAELDHPTDHGPELPSPRDARRRRRRAEAEARAALARVGVARADQLRALAAAPASGGVEPAEDELEAARAALAAIEERADRARSDAPLHAAVEHVRARADSVLGAGERPPTPAALRAAATGDAVVGAAARRLVEELRRAAAPVVDDLPELAGPARDGAAAPGLDQGALDALVTAATAWLGEEEQRSEERARLETEIATLDDALVRLHAADAEFVLLARVAELRRLDTKRRTPVVCDAVVDHTDPARRIAILGLLAELAELQPIVLLTGSEVVVGWAVDQPADAVGCFDVAVARAGASTG